MQERLENVMVQNRNNNLYLYLQIGFVQKLFLVPRQNLQFLFRVASLFVVLCMYLSSYVVCADLVCILWVSTIHMCPWGIIFSIYHNSARLCCLTQRASDLVEWGPMLQCAREGWHTLCSSDNFAPLEQLSCIQTHFASQHTANVFPIESAGNPCVEICSL